MNMNSIVTKSICVIILMLMVTPVFSQEPSQVDLQSASLEELEAMAKEYAEMVQAYKEKLKINLDWWSKVKSEPDSWYRSEDGRRMAENILSWQNKEAGGWPLMNTTREPFTGDLEKAGPWGTVAALIKATVNEIRFLARAYKATADERYKTAAIAGLKFILKAQYPSGGWPHSYPVRMSDYTHYATFNDDMMPDLMRLLNEVATTSDFEFLDPDMRKAAGSAFDKGVDFILKSQIVVDGRLTAWCQQHDEVTYEPRPARVFEPVAITGGESAGLLLVLMSIKNPSPEVVRAIEGGVDWYRRSQINGLKVIHTIHDCIVREYPDAPPIWARFYEIKTNRPIFVGRDGVVRYNLAEIDKERRTGYEWYNSNGTIVFDEYEKWRATNRIAPPTNTDESKVRSYTLPEPLVMTNGRRVTDVNTWITKRRPEIIRLFEEYQGGRTPSKQLTPQYEIFEENAPAMGGTAKRMQVRIKFSNEPNTPIIRLLLHIPANAKGHVPTLLHLGFSPAVLVIDEPGIDEGMAWSATTKTRVPDRQARRIGEFNIKYFVERGYGVAYVYYGDIDPDFQGGAPYGIRSLFGQQTETRKPNEWGTIGSWSWGLSRILDYLLTNPTVNGKKVALSGVSRLGKTVLWAAAQDERFALIIPLLSGEGGAAISRRNYGETIADLTNPKRFPYWYAPRYADYAFDVDSLPVDGHMLLTLLAPRPVLLITGSEDTWSDPKGEFVAALAAEPVYRLFGKQGLGISIFPDPETKILNDMGYYMHEGKHTTLPRDFEVIADFMDKHFGKPSDG